MAEIQNISIELVKIHPNNVRKTYNDIEELAESIKAKGKKAEDIVKALTEAQKERS